MKILLLCRNLRVAGGRVVGINFIKALKAHPNDHQYFIVAPPGAGYEDIELPQGSKMIVYNGGSSPFAQWKYDTCTLKKLAEVYNPDVVFAMGNVGLVYPPCPQAILFHKPHMVYPAVHFARETKKSRFKNWLYKRRIAKCLKNTQLVFCQTSVARQRFHRSFDYPLSQIKILPNAVSEFIQIEKSQVKKPQVFKDSSFFNLFFLTKFYAHKNLESLIDLFKSYRQELEHVRCLITIAADQHPNAVKFLHDISRFGLEDKIVNVGPLRQDELAGYFYHADALLFPTLMESFSGTYLEAMHFGLPILTSDLDFAKYVCDDAAMYFSPWDTSDMAEKIIHLKNDDNLQANLVRKGKKRINEFFISWEEVTFNTISELEAIVSDQYSKPSPLAN
jgi:glycosyltransferase involved in cell wall biosynthesis